MFVQHLKKTKVWVGEQIDDKIFNFFSGKIFRRCIRMSGQLSFFYFFLIDSTCIDDSGRHLYVPLPVDDCIQSDNMNNCLCICIQKYLFSSSWFPWTSHPTAVQWGSLDRSIIYKFNWATRQHCRVVCCMSFSQIGFI